MLELYYKILSMTFVETFFAVQSKYHKKICESIQKNCEKYNLKSKDLMDKIKIIKMIITFFKVQT